MNRVGDIICDKSLDYSEKQYGLCCAAENSLPSIPLSSTAQQMFETGVLCDIHEGHAPYRPRYILPDYERFLNQGSPYLNLSAPQDLFEAVNALMIIYRFVPSITGYPVYLGQLDQHLEPFCHSVTKEECKRILEMFSVFIDRTLPNAFVHANIGPFDTTVGRHILDIERSQCKAVPNLSLKHDLETPDDFARLAVKTALTTGKPYFVNHSAFTQKLGENYGIASCYNTLKIGGGSHTLVRLNLKELAKNCIDYRDFSDNKLPEAVECLCHIINARARFLVEEAGFFESSFLVREGLIDLKNFTSMAGVFGLYEAVETLSGGARLGHDTEANDMARAITELTHDLIKEQKGVYCEGYNGHIGFHAQSGIDTDVDVTAGVRIKCGQEPSLGDQCRIAGQLHPYFDTGVSEICVFDQTALNNLDGVLKVIKGSLEVGVGILAISSAESELIRITGYLVKRSDLAAHTDAHPLREQTVQLGAATIQNSPILKRRVRKGFEGHR